MTLRGEILATVSQGGSSEKRRTTIRMKTASRFSSATALVFLLASLTSPVFTMSALARGGDTFRGAPGPIVGAGLPLLAIGGIGYGVYWLVKRRRKAG
jgi:hypothetical protein